MSNIFEDLAKYRVHSRREIISLLRAMKERSHLVNMRANGVENVVTSILEVNEAGNLIVIDRAPSRLTNQRLIDSDRITIETTLDNIRILFFAEQMQECLYEDAPALCTPIPPNLIRLQRREHYRVSTPVINPWRCAIPVPNEDGQGFNTEFVVLINISAGGIGVIDEKKLLNTTIGLVYKNCRIEIPGANPIVTSLEVRNSLDQTLPNGKAVRRIGFMFIDLPKAMLTTIQRNITKLEREYNAKATGMV